MLSRQITVEINMHVNFLQRNVGRACLATFLLLGTALEASAAAPQIKTSAPGYYRMMLGDFEVTAVSDGTVDLKVSDLLTNVRADKRDADFWLSKSNMEAAPKDAKQFFEAAMAALNPYIAANKFKPFDGNTDLTPGIKGVATHGHTPGHTIFVVESQGQRLDLWGDLMHVAAVQFPQPAVTIRFDTNAKAAAAQRKKEYAAAAKRGYWVGAAHLPFPGLGHLRSDGSGYDWTPANYSAMR